MTPLHIAAVIHAVVFVLYRKLAGEVITNLHVRARIAA